MPRKILSFVLMTVIALGAGAYGSRLFRPEGGVAVVDLDRVAKELGRDVLMANEFKANQSALTNELSSIQAVANEQLKKMEDELGADASDEEKMKLKQTADIAQQRFNQLQKQADGKLAQHRAQLVTSFREQARPIVDEIAKEHGANAVVSNTVFYSFDHTIDITNEVIARLRVTPSAFTTPAVAVPTPAAPAAPAATPEAVPAGSVAEAPEPAAAPDRQVRQASASTAKPLPKPKTATSAAKPR